MLSALLAAVPGAYGYPAEDGVENTPSVHISPSRTTNSFASPDETEYLVQVVAAATELTRYVTLVDTARATQALLRTVAGVKGDMVWENLDTDVDGVVVLGGSVRYEWEV